MLVRDRMSRHPITTTPGASVPDALKVMQGAKVRQLPVLNEQNAMVGIVSLVDLFRVSPSPATSLSVWEVDYLLEKIKVEQVMTREVITVTEDTPVEEAGRIMSDNRISGLPVMRDAELVGIITESHLFNILLELFGARTSGVRVMAKISHEQGILAKITGAIAAAGGQIEALGLHGDSETVTCKVVHIDRDAVIAAIKPLVVDVLDVREI
ncbi:MAG: CBS domain-containing protein [Actinobacteria bacterium]|nr:CBS domain-containing protein [Actinomycetota bacterium]